MSKIASLGSAPTDPILAAESTTEREIRTTVRLSALASFVIQGGIQPKLGGSLASVIRALVELAVLDWLEGNGFDKDSEEFRAKYLRFLTQQEELLPEEDPETGRQAVGYQTVRL